MPSRWGPHHTAAGTPRTHTPTHSSQRHTSSMCAPLSLLFIALKHCKLRACAPRTKSASAPSRQPDSTLFSSLTAPCSAHCRHTPPPHSHSHTHPPASLVSISPTALLQPHASTFPTRTLTHLLTLHPPTHLDWSRLCLLHHHAHSLAHSHTHPPPTTHLNSISPSAPPHRTLAPPPLAGNHGRRRERLSSSWRWRRTFRTRRRHSSTRRTMR
jgi:hypothetical protein